MKPAEKTPRKPKPKTPHWSAKLEVFSPCTEAIVWARKQPTAAKAWATCPRADWMLWIAARTCGERGSKEHRAVVLAACACARTALKYVRKGEKRPLAAIEMTERWARGAGTIIAADLRDAAGASDAAGDDAVAAGDYVSADAADAAAYAAYAGCGAGADAHAAAEKAAYAASDCKALKTMAPLVRRFIEHPNLRKG